MRGDVDNLVISAPLLGDQHPEQTQRAHLSQQIGGASLLVPCDRRARRDLLLREVTAPVDETAFGGYLMWRFPQLDLVIHGYGDTFTDAELERNADLDGARSGWRELLRGTGAQYAVLPPGSPLAYDLRQIEHWRVLEHSADLQLLQAPPGWADDG